MPDVTMPRLSDTMEEGTIVRWLASDGAEVQRGQEIVEIETDKATMAYESEFTGTLHVVAGEGDTLPIGAPIARVLAAGEAPDAPAAASAPAAPTNGHAPAPEPEPALAAAPAAPPASAAPAGSVRVRASPLARRVALALGVDLQALRGTGAGGRIVRRDVEEAQPPPPTAAPEPAPAPPTAPPPEPTGRGTITVEALSATQTTIARRMAEAKATIPEFTLTIDVDMDAAVALRASLAAIAPDDAPSYNDMVVKACGLALRAHPRANGSFREGGFELHGRVNVGVAVAVENALVVPTVHDADVKTLGEIRRETRRLAGLARDGALTPPDLAGGTFTVSNLGMFGVSSFTAVINPPQAAILAVGALEQRAVVRDGALVVSRRMTITLTSDHRILYGADAAAFLTDVRLALEQPLRLVL